MWSMLLMYAVTAYMFVMFALYMLGIVRLVKDEGHPPLLFAFLPVAHDYARAVIIGLRGRYLRILAPLATGVLIIALMFPNIYFLSLALLLFLTSRCFLNFYTYEKKTAILFTLLGLAVPFSSGIWIYHAQRKRL